MGFWFAPPPLPQRIDSFFFIQSVSSGSFLFVDFGLCFYFIYIYYPPPPRYAGVMGYGHAESTGPIFFFCFYHPLCIVEMIWVFFFVVSYINFQVSPPFGPFFFVFVELKCHFSPPTTAAKNKRPQFVSAADFGRLFKYSESPSYKVIREVFLKYSEIL